MPCYFLVAVYTDVIRIVVTEYTFSAYKMYTCCKVFENVTDVWCYIINSV